METSEHPDIPLLRRGDRCYSVVDGVFHVYDRELRVLRRIPLPLDEKTPAWREMVDCHWRVSGGGRASDNMVMGPWHLTADPFRERLLANNLNCPALVFSADLDGRIEWMTLLGPECCNAPCLVPTRDRILHASSCGRRVSSLSSEGVVLRHYQLPRECMIHGFVDDGKGGGILITRDRTLPFDADANLIRGG